MRRIKPPNIHLPPPLHFSHQWESVIDSKEKTMHVHSASPLYSESKQTGWSTCANSIPSFMTSDIRLYMQIYRVNNQGSGLKLHLMKRHRFACGLAWKQHTHTHKILSSFTIPCAISWSSLWLCASLTITSIVLATKPASLPSIFYLLWPWANKPDQVSQMST